MNANPLGMTLATCALLVACETSTSVELLPPFEGDPATVVMPADLSYACRGWSQSPPDVDYGLFDVFFTYHTSGDPEDRPTADQRAQILRLNGRIVHEFNVPMIRAVLQPVAVPELDANITRGVPDAAVFPVGLSVAWRELPAPADSDFVESLGGAFTGYGWRYEFDGETHVWLPMLFPDSAIPLLRAYPEVALVSPSGGVFCLDNE